MRLIAVSLALALSFLSPACPAWAATFVPGIEDLPLMPALSADEGSEMVFDTPAGRIVEASATGDVTHDAVIEFYAKTLPQLGWVPAGTGRFMRENEELRIDFPAGREKPGDGPVTVRFSLKPAP